MKVINLEQLEAFPSGSEVTPELLAEKGFLRGKNPKVKILGAGRLTKPLTVKAHGASAKAREKIAACGGTLELLNVHA
jgi:large subunit ribosomal protein L15